MSAEASGRSAGPPSAAAVTATLADPDCFLRMRLSAIDFVSSYDRSEYDNRRSPYSKDVLTSVPTIRIFGATDKGQRVCAHVHGGFPYVYVAYDGALDPESVNGYIAKFGAALNRAMDLSLPSKKGKNQEPQHVAFIVLCKGVSFYGYHVGYSPFLKIYTVNPRSQKRLSEILRSGAVLNTQFDVFEDHIPFLLQFMLDSNLYGCGWMDIGECKFREGVPEHEDAPSDEYNPPSCAGPYGSRIYTTRTVPASRLHPSPEDGGPEKFSYEALEIDIPISAILNRHRLTENPIHHDFVELLHPESVMQGPKVASVKELWRDERMRRNARGEDGPFPVQDTAPRLSDDFPSNAPNSRVEAGQRQKLQSLLAESLKAYQEKLGGRGNKEPEFETFVRDQELMKGKQSGWLDRVRTSFDQRDAVYIERFEEDEKSSYVYGAWAVKGIGLNISKEQEAKWRRQGSAEVDVGRLKASQAASKAARIFARERAKQERTKKGGDPDAVVEDSEEEEELASESEDDDGGARRPATQAQMLAKSRRAMDRAEHRGREYSADAAYEDAEDDEEDNFYGFDFGADKVVSPRPSDDDDDASSVGTRPSVSPSKSAYSSPVKRSVSDEEETSPSKKQKLGDGEWAVREAQRMMGSRASVTPSPGYIPRPRVPRYSVDRTSPTATRSSPLRAPATSITPTRLRYNPFVSPDKPVSVRVASAGSSPTVIQSPDEDVAGDPLFTFRSPPVNAELVEPEAPHPSPPPSPMKQSRSPSAEAFPDSSPQSLDKVLAPSSPLSPSQALEAELADIPLGAFDDEYYPTPTVKHEDQELTQSQQRPPSSATRFIDDSESSDDELEEEKPVIRPSPSPTPTLPDLALDDDAGRDELEGVEDEDDVEMGEVERAASPAPAPEKKQRRKRVAFQLSQDSQASSSTPIPSIESAPERVSQSTTDSEGNPRPPPGKPSYPLAHHSFTYAQPPPSAAELLACIETYKISSQGRSRIVYQDPYYSNPADVPHKDREYGGRKFKIKGSTIDFLPHFRHFGRDWEVFTHKGARPIPPRVGKVTAWEFAARPPTGNQATEWLEANGLISEAKKPRFDPIKSQIEAPTQKMESDKFTSIKGAVAQREKQHMAVLSMELHVNTRGRMLPNPQMDAIEVLFYCLQSDNDDLDANGRSDNTHVGVIVVGSDREIKAKLGNVDYVVEVVDTERDLVELFVEKIRYEWNPECVGGFEVHHSSWGYLLERASYEFDWNLVPELGRVRSFDTGKFGNAQSDRWGFNQSSTLSFSGRHVLAIWRILKADNKFQQNTFEHFAFHVLGLRTPHFSFKTLTQWFKSGDPALFSRVFQYWRNRVEMDIEILDAAEVIDQTCESARVFGVDFNSVRTRGSQFKVESVMFKISKPESFMLLSPNRQQVGKQNAAECMPLIMEPQSAFYKGPLVVLDFQSLYPSVMIAYNYCYSTCLGRVENFKGTQKLGVSQSDLPDGLLHLLKDHITISPNGIMFVKPAVRMSLLAKMLGELLDTRVMVKSSMKGIEGDKALMKLLNARQLALKFLANVTYGYTSATFSGRMPMVEIADAIVQTGRETLEKAKQIIESKKEWGAEVKYGDTDSLFIYLRGKSKDDAFRIGYEMSELVTSMNPRPIKLKFEKVYLPCVLLAKKRYVGFKYEYPSQKEPDFDAKGIETVRRDGIPATQKMQEWCLKDFFRHADLSRIKEYLQRQWKKIQAGDVSPQDFTIAKKVRLGSYAEGRAPPPGAAVASRAMLRDPRAEPEYGERVPYILTVSEPDAKQIDRALSPQQFLSDPRIRLDAAHYIERMMIPPLERIFNLVGADVKSWYKEMAKSKRVHKAATKNGTKRIMLDEHFASDRCVACNGPNGNGGICDDCRSHPAEAVYTLEARRQALLHRQRALHQICSSCSSNPPLTEIECDSHDCQNLYARVRNGSELEKIVDLDF